MVRLKPGDATFVPGEIYGKVELKSIQHLPPGVREVVVAHGAQVEAEPVSQAVVEEEVTEL